MPAESRRQEGTVNNYTIAKKIYEEYKDASSFWPGKSFTDYLDNRIKNESNNKKPPCVDCINGSENYCYRNGYGSYCGPLNNYEHGKVIHETI